MTILVTGGAGYVGSHIVLALLDRGEDVAVLDDHSAGVRPQAAKGVRVFEGNAGDAALARRVLRETRASAVIHCAGWIVAPESVEKPLLYYANNTAASRTLIEACVAEGVRHFIFSSTALVYGPPLLTAMPETTLTQPVNPYGRSKLMTEWILEDAARAHGFCHATLRYFNVAGADLKGRAGQSTPVATHLIKRACQVALGRIPHIDIFGTDFPTPDGTGVRDYIFVGDLAAAHLLALDHLTKGGNSLTLNCGYGHGASVREVIRSVERVTGKKLTVREGPRRPGDPPALVADATRIKRELGWKPAHDNLDEIVASAYAWEQRLNSSRAR
jgi:UDP-glucose 4-epimerase